MKKFFLFAITLISMTGISMAANNEAATTTKASSASNTTSTAPASAISMTELLQENENLKLALSNTASQTEALTDQLRFGTCMQAVANNLYEEQLKNQQEEANEKSAFAWMMHSVIVTLNALNKNE